MSEALSDAASTDPAFFSRLCQLGVAGLHAERDRVGVARGQLRQQTRQLAFQHYPTFISAADTCHAIHAHFEGCQTELQELLSDRLPSLQRQARQFETKAGQEVAGQRKLASLVLQRHTKLLEVLELPQLMETCVRNGHYEEALSLQQLAQQLAKSPGLQDIPLLQQVLAAVHASAQWMLEQLLGRLRQAIQLPECLKIIGYLRRLGVFSETELRLKFLQARQVHFDAVLDGLERGGDGSLDTYAHLCRVVEVTRLNVFDTITQYRALFADEDPVVATPSLAAGQGVTYRQIFSSWLYRRLHLFRQTFQRRLQAGAHQIEDQSLESLLGQVMYFGQSLGRVGFDFRALVVPLFTAVILDRASAPLDEGREALRATLERGGPAVTPTTTLLAHAEAPAAADALVMPALTYYPLAEVCNAVIQAVNELRYCTPMVGTLVLTERLRHFLEAAERALLEYRDRLREGGGSQTDARDADKMMEQFRTEVLPFVNRVCKMAFAEREYPADFPKYSEMASQHEVSEEKEESDSEPEIRSQITHDVTEDRAMAMAEDGQSPEVVADQKPEAVADQKPEAVAEQQEEEVNQPVEVAQIVAGEKPDPVQSGDSAVEVVTGETG